MGNLKDLVPIGKYIGAGIAIAAAAGGAGQGIGNIGGKAIEAISRQPEQKSTLQTLMFLTIALAETTAIYGLVIAFMILFA